MKLRAAAMEPAEMRARIALLSIERVDWLIQTREVRIVIPVALRVLVEDSESREFNEDVQLEQH